MKIDNHFTRKTLEVGEMTFMIENINKFVLKEGSHDNGWEYRDAFEHYCKTHGIRRDSVPRMDWVAKRFNTTMVENVKKLLSHAKLPKSF